MKRTKKSPTAKPNPAKASTPKPVASTPTAPAPATAPTPVAPPVPTPTPQAPPTPARQIDVPPAPPVDSQAETASLLEQLRGGEFSARLAAAAKLGKLGTPVAVEALKTALRDSTAEVAREAVLALASKPSPAIVSALTSVLENRDGYFHSLTRAAAADSLGQINDATTIPALVLAIRDPFADPSRAAIRALARVASADQAASVLIQVITNADNYFLPSVRVAAVAALADVQTDAARVFLRGLVANPAEAPEVREALTGKVL